MFDKSGEPKLLTVKRKRKNRCREWLAACELLKFNFIFGVGCLQSHNILKNCNAIFCSDAYKLDLNSKKPYM